MIISGTECLPHLDNPLCNLSGSPRRHLGRHGQWNEERHNVVGGFEYAIWKTKFRFRTNCMRLTKNIWDWMYAYWIRTKRTRTRLFCIRLSLVFTKLIYTEYDRWRLRRTIIVTYRLVFSWRRMPPLPGYLMPQEKQIRLTRYYGIVMRLDA